MVDHDAAVHHDGGTRRGGAGRGLLVDAAELEPQGRCAGREGVIDDIREVLAPSEYVHYLNAAGNVRDPAVDAETEDLLLAWVDGHDLITAIEQVAGDAVRVAMRLGRESDDGDPPGLLEEFPDGLLTRVTEQTSPC